MKIPHLRWILCFLLFLSTTLCFLDRQVLSVVAPKLCEEFKMDNTTYGYATTAFLVSYAFMFLVGGRLVDLMGTRFGLGLSVAFWSLASGIHGLIHSPFQLGVARFFLGVGEGACFPGAAKAASEWFPKRERALAIGIAIGGASLGGVIAPPLTVWCFNTFGWRETFFCTGIIGAIWTLCWFFLYDHPKKNHWVTRGELDYILQDEHEKTTEVVVAKESQEESLLLDTLEQAPVIPPKKEGIFHLFTRRDVIGLSLARFLFDPVFYFYMFWIPQYLNQERNLSLESIGQLTWIPFFALGISNIMGGWFSDRLVRRGLEPLTARKRVMALAALATMSSGVAAISPNAGFAITMMAILMFAHGFWITNYVTIISDRFDGGSVATVMGITGMIGTIGGMMANTAIGYVTDRFSFFPVWIASGCLYPAALLVILISIRNQFKENSHEICKKQCQVSSETKAS